LLPNLIILKIDEERAKEIAINFLTHGKLNVINCSAILKGTTWRVMVSVEKPTKVTRVVEIDAESGRIMSATDFRDPKNFDGSKLSSLGLGVFYCIANFFGDDSPVQTATCITNIISQCS
jgi:hypothetical protein